PDEAVGVLDHDIFDLGDRHVGQLAPLRVRHGVHDAHRVEGLGPAGNAAARNRADAAYTTGPVSAAITPARVFVHPAVSMAARAIAQARPAPPTTRAMSGKPPVANAPRSTRPVASAAPTGSTYAAASSQRSPTVIEGTQKRAYSTKSAG